MGAIRTVVVDDEKLARDRLVGFLAGLDDVSLLGQAADGVEALRLIEEERPDLVFLDVQMPGMDGFEVLKALREPPRHVVFSTAYDEYAIRAFEVGAVDYLLKPFGRRRVEEAVGRVRARLGAANSAPDWESVLKRLEERLDPETFFRAHKSSLVNLKHVKEIQPWFGGRYKLVMRDQARSEVALSRVQARALRARLRW